MWAWAEGLEFREYGLGGLGCSSGISVWGLGLGLRDQGLGIGV